MTPLIRPAAAVALVSMLLLACNAGDRSRGQVAAGAGIVIAEIGDRTITQAELDSWLRAALWEAQIAEKTPAELYELRSEGLNEMLDERLLEAEAELANESGLDLAAFKTCMSEHLHDDTVETDVREGSEAGVNGTPAFFINGIPLTGALPLERFVQVIDGELARIRSAGESGS